MFGPLRHLKFWRWRIFHLRRKKKKEKELSPLPSIDNQELEHLQQELKNDYEQLEKELKEKNKVSDKPTLYPSRNMALITTESDMKLRPINVRDDHMINYNGKDIRIKYDRPAHILDLSLHDLMPTRKQRFMCKLFGVPKYQTFRTYTFQAEGELTHNPNKDGLDEKQKMRFEKLIQLEAVAVKAAIAANIMKGLKDRGAWWEVLGPIIAIVIVVAFFLFAFEVQPNL